MWKPPTLPKSVPEFITITFLARFGTNIMSSHLVFEVVSGSDHWLVELQRRNVLIIARLVLTTAVVPFKCRFRNVQTDADDPVHDNHVFFDFVFDLFVRRAFDDHIVQDDSELSELIIRRKREIWISYELFKFSVRRHRLRLVQFNVICDTMKPMVDNGRRR